MRRSQCLWSLQGKPTTRAPGQELLARALLEIAKYFIHQMVIQGMQVKSSIRIWSYCYWTMHSEPFFFWWPLAPAVLCCRCYWMLQPAWPMFDHDLMLFDPTFTVQLLEWKLGPGSGQRAVSSSARGSTQTTLAEHGRVQLQCPPLQGAARHAAGSPWMRITSCKDQRSLSWR